MSDKKVVKLHPDVLSVGQFMDGAVAEAAQFKAERVYLTMFNAEGESVSLEYNITISDAALMAIDCLGMAIAGRDGTVTLFKD